MNVCYWHKADNSTVLTFVRFRTIADKAEFWGGLSAFDPKRTFTGYFSAPPPSRTRRVTFGHLPEKVK